MINIRHTFIYQNDVKARGVEDTGSTTVTSKLGGVYKTDPAVRAEFMAIFHSPR